jgi:hypothetical protein
VLGPGSGSPDGFGHGSEPGTPVGGIPIGPPSHPGSVPMRPSSHPGRDFIGKDHTACLLKGHSNEADFPKFLHESVQHR